nr:immunoglobulin heavy chain junction region [Mus musculus]
CARGYYGSPFAYW